MAKAHQKWPRGARGARLGVLLGVASGRSGTGSLIGNRTGSRRAWAAGAAACRPGRAGLPGLPGKRLSAWDCDVAGHRAGAQPQQLAGLLVRPSPPAVAAAARRPRLARAGRERGAAGAPTLVPHARRLPGLRLPALDQAQAGGGGGLPRGLRLQAASALRARHQGALALTSPQCSVRCVRSRRPPASTRTGAGALKGAAARGQGRRRACPQACGSGQQQRVRDSRSAIIMAARAGTPGARLLQAAAWWGRHRGGV
jgi:hypothetical protein